MQTPSGPGWWTEVPEAQRRHLRVWLWTGAALTLLSLIVGGGTRLTQSGLSIVDWDPIVGVIPPRNQAQWQEAFARYREFPEYRQLRSDMTLAEFRSIFMWEYVHRIVARLIGVVFLIPFVWFGLRGYLTRPLLKRVLLLFALGGAQGLMGWLMVRSGLVDRPRVSHYRLAMHLSLAFAIFGCCLWLASELTARPALAIAEDARRFIERGLRVVGALLTVQIVWGALVAGLKAGFFFNTFPLMGGNMLPPGGMDLRPVIRNLVDNPVTVQWMHRVLGTILLATAAIFVRQVWRRTEEAELRRFCAALLALILTQYALGVLTLMYVVPIPLGLTHQATAMVTFGVWLSLAHRVRSRAAVSYLTPQAVQIQPGLAR